jgi:hypothetical protein
LNFLREAESYDEYRPWIRDDFLKRVFAEAKIVNGIGDPQQRAPLLSPDEYRRLKERVDIDIAPDNPDVFADDAVVRLTAFVKNVPALIVKIYEINTFNYYRETGQPLNLAINLDGLVASSERRIQYEQTPSAASRVPSSSRNSRAMALTWSNSSATARAAAPSCRKGGWVCSRKSPPPGTRSPSWTKRADDCPMPVAGWAGGNSPPVRTAGS